MWGGRGNNNTGNSHKVAEHTVSHSDHNDNNSVFGDAYSIQSRRSISTNRLSHEMEADYDRNPTKLYGYIENKQWDAALRRLQQHPDEAKTWVSRRESNGKTRWRLLPLHAVCIFRAPLSFMEALIQTYEEAPQLPDDQGMLPVHLACRNGASKGVVLTLLAAFPHSIQYKDRKGRTLHDLVANSSSTNKESVLKALTRFEQELAQAKSMNAATAATTTGTTTNHESSAVVAKSDETNGSSHNQSNPNQPHRREVDYDNRSMLFRYILKKDWKAAVARVQSHPEEAATWIATKGFHGSLRFLPIHKACVLQPPRNLIQQLLHAYPDGASDKDQDGWLPIHCACFYNADDAIVELLLQQYPNGSHCKDDDGRLALHYACLKGASEGTVDSLLQSNAKAALHKDNEGRLPIHHACSKGAPESVIDSLLKAAPKGAQSKDDQGRLALHHACRKTASERVIRTLLKVYSRASSIKDDQEKLPLHYSCQHGGSLTVIMNLVQAYPESLNVKNSFGNTAVDEAREAVDNGNVKMESVVKYLLKAKQELAESTIENAKSDKATIMAMEQRIQSLEGTLGKISSLGKAVKAALHKKKTPLEILDRFADDLIQMNGPSTKVRGISNSNNNNSKAVVGNKDKDRSTTPSRGIFGRGNNNNNATTAMAVTTNRKA
jgi:ankyrin repeat protein